MAEKPHETWVSATQCPKMQEKCGFSDEITQEWLEKSRFPVSRKAARAALARPGQEMAIKEKRAKTRRNRRFSSHCIQPNFSDPAKKPEK